MAKTKETEKKIEETISPEVKDNENQDNLEVNKADVNVDNVQTDTETAIQTEETDTETAIQTEATDTETAIQTEETEKKNDKTLTVTENLKDKYGQVVIFQKDNTIVASKKVNGNEIVESGKGQYQVSVERYEELKNCPYVK